MTYSYTLLKEDSYESTCFINLISPTKSLAIAIGVLAVVVLPFLSYYTVNEGERGILLRYGKNRKVAEPGLGFKIPFMESVEKFPRVIRLWSIRDYRPTAATSNRHK